MARKRIVFFIESFSGGGAERVLLTILRKIDLSRFKVTILVISDSGVYSSDFRKLPVSIVPALNYRSTFLNKLKYKLIYNILPPSLTVKWLLKGIKADTYVAFVEGYCTKILSYLQTDKRKIAWVHIDLKNFPWPIEKGIYSDRLKEGTAYKCYDEVIGVSNDTSEAIRGLYGLKSVRTIYNPIDEGRIMALSKETGNIDVDGTAFNIISVGRLTRQKGYDKLLRLMPEVLKANPSVRLYIVGEGEERKSLEDQIKELHLSDNVILTGFLENPYSLMSNMDLFVCSSVAEGFSLVIAEAMICGLSVVSMKCAGPNELLDQGRYGVLCSTYDELADALVDISTDKARLSGLREKSRKRAADFNTQNTIATIENLL